MTRIRHKDGRGLCVLCGTDHRRGPTFWALADDLAESKRAGMIIALALDWDETREEIVRIVGQAAQAEGKSFDESLTAYFLIYTDGEIPAATPYGGRVTSRGKIPQPQAAPAILAAPIQAGRIQSRGKNGV